jgi:hypothetical protein
MKTQTVDMDPGRATRMLDKGGVNRALSPGTVSKYARDMKAGRWLQTGEPIIVGDSGQVLDGQHRLRAVVESGVTVSMLLVSGVGQEAIHSIDTGKPRSAADVLGLLGHKNTNRLASVARHVHEAYSGASGRLSVAEIEGVIAKRPGVQWIMSNSANSTGTMGIAPVLAAFAICYDKNPEAAASAWGAFRDGADLKKGDPMLALRNYLLITAQTTNAASTHGGRASIVRRALTALCYSITGKSLFKAHDGMDGIRYFCGERAAKGT